ncbi:NCS2 family permease [Clostridium sp. chh4-2]|uniref:NCS2 family permease n=1 Tax=Clostridium sp. chh4-2 TaxID=2067550 RepID=UPI000CCE1A73|nr:NCS2 family permease [Clostridium sp. chh4-2]PNV63253.1 NCS2 family permease [Clostridium sp. chh4-2]
MDTIEKRFHLREHGTTLRTEILAGATTFATMAYICVLQPLYMKQAGMDAVGVLLSTALVSGLITMFMGWYSNMPIALAPGIASSVVLTFSIVQSGLATWETGLGMVMVSALLFLILSLFKLREKVVELIPKNIKVGISAGLGVFIIRTALVNAKLINPDFRGFGDMSDPSVRLAAISTVLCLLLSFVRIRIGNREYKIRASLLITIILATLIGIPMGVTQAPSSLFTQGGIKALGNVAFKLDLLGALKPEYVAFIFAFFISDFFGTLATALGLGAQMGQLDENGNLPVIGKIFLADSIGSVLGAAMGLTIVTSYVESAAGIEVGGKTGLSSIFTGIFFLFTMLFAPIFLMIPTAATTPVLIMIGISMMQGLKTVDYEATEWTPVAILIMSTLFYGISQGIGIGLFAYCMIKTAYYLFTGEKGQMPSLMTWAFTVLACLQFVL